MNNISTCDRILLYLRLISVVYPADPPYFFADIGAILAIAKHRVLSNMKWSENRVRAI